GGHTFCRDTVVARGDDDCRVEPRRDESADLRQAAAEVLEPAEAPARLRLRVVGPPRLVVSAHESLKARPATTKNASSAAATQLAFTRPSSSRYARASALAGTIPRPTSFVTAIVRPSRAAGTAPSPPFAIHSERQSTMTVRSPGTPARARRSSTGSSTVVHSGGRSAWWRAMRSAISS